MRLAALLAGLLALAALQPAAAQNVTVARLDGPVRTIDLAMVKRLPPVQDHLSFLTGHGSEAATCAGALLWSLLDQAGTLGADPRPRVRLVVLVTGRDGYAAVLALAELDPAFEGKKVVLAYRRDDGPMPGQGLRLVVPGDRRGGRSVRDVVRIEIR